MTWDIVPAGPGEEEARRRQGRKERKGDYRCVNEQVHYW